MSQSNDPTTEAQPQFKGLPMATPPDAERLAEERAWLSELAQKPWPSRAVAYLRNGGPGYLQSALTLGGGSASASLLAGAAFGYDLLWVAPLAMAIGTIMLAAVAHQTLSTGMRPFEAMRRYAGPVFAWGWALGALVSSVVWHFAQYSLASAVVVDIGELSERSVSRTLAGAGILVWAIITSQLFGSGSRLTTWLDRFLKVLIWGIVAIFGVVAFRSVAQTEGALGLIWDGLTSFRIPEDRGEVSGLALVISGLAAAVVVNMVFLYPYTLLSRGWGREHRELARFDLVFGMFLPYVLATGLMVVAAANTIHLDFSGKGIAPVEAAQTVGSLLGSHWGRLLFDLGLLGMVLTTITMHMLCSAFAASEMFGWRFGSAKYRLALLLPIPGVLGCVYWQDMSVWIAVPTSILSGLMLPLAYIGFIKLQASKAYLGDDKPSGGKGTAWLGGMVLGTSVVVIFLAWYIVTKGPGYWERLQQSFS